MPALDGNRSFLIKFKKLNNQPAAMAMCCACGSNGGISWQQDNFNKIIKKVNNQPVATVTVDGKSNCARNLGQARDGNSIMAQSCGGIVASLAAQ